jgi:hypothetical protein
MYAKETVSALPANSGHCAIWRKITRRPSGHVVRSLFVSNK